MSQQVVDPARGEQRPGGAAPGGAGVAPAPEPHPHAALSDAAAKAFEREIAKYPPAGKASAVIELMQHAPFRGRRPIFIGDDVTDEPVFGIIGQFGGLGFSVGRTVEGADGHFSRPEQVRSWLDQIAANRGDAVG